MSVEVMKFTPYRKGLLLGFADIYVVKMGLEIHGISVMEKDGKKWANLPSKEYKNDQGESKYAPIIRFRDKDLNIRFCNMVMDAIASVMPQDEVNNSYVDEQGDLPF